MSKNNKGYKPVSVGGWMGTILLSAIPGLNILMWMIWAFFARKPSRRSFAVAMLVLTVLFIILTVVAVFLWGSEILEWARSLDPEMFSPEAVG